MNIDGISQTDMDTSRIKVTCYLPDQRIRRLEKESLNKGGMRERMMQGSRCK